MKRTAFAILLSLFLNALKLCASCKDEERSVWWGVNRRFVILLMPQLGQLYIWKGQWYTATPKHFSWWLKEQMAK